MSSYMCTIHFDNFAKRQWRTYESLHAATVLKPTLSWCVEMKM